MPQHTRGPAARRPVGAPPGAPAPQPLGARLPAWAAALGVGALHAVLCALAFDPGPYMGGDNGTYVALARGLLERGVYVDYWDPALRPHTQYPPVFPLILAAGIGAGLTVWVGVKVLCIALSVAAVAVSALWLRRLLPPGAALAAAVLVSITPGALTIAAQVLSDVPFWTWTVLALWAYARADAAGEGERPWRWEALGAAALILAYFTRTAGLPLAVAAAAWLVLRRHWRSLAILAGTLGPLVFAWSLRGRSLGGTSVYAREFWWVNPYAPNLGTIGPREFLARVLDNLTRYGTDRLPTLFFGEQAAGATWSVMLASALVLLAALGWGLQVRRPGVAELFTPLYIGLLLAWPATWSGERFILPILPLLLGYAAVMLQTLSARTLPRAIPAAAWALFALTMLPGVRHQVELGAQCRREYQAGEAVPCHTPVWSQLVGIAPRLQGVLPEGAVVIHRKPTLFFVMSGYRSFLYPKSADPDTFFAAARAGGAEYVVIDQLPDMAPYLHGVVAARPHQFCVVREFSDENAALARIVEGAPPMDPSRPPGTFRTCPPTGPPLP